MTEERDVEGNEVFNRLRGDCKVVDRGAVDESTFANVVDTFGNGDGGEGAAFREGHHRRWR